MENDELSRGYPQKIEGVAIERKTRWTEAIAKQARELRDQGHGLAEIAATVGLSMSYVSTRLREQSAPSRESGAGVEADVPLSPRPSKTFGREEHSLPIVISGGAEQLVDALSALRQIGLRVVLET